MTTLENNPLRDLNNASNLPRDTPETDAIALHPAPPGTHLLEYIIKLQRERDEARKQNAQLRDISERAIALAALDEENDKYGAVSQLRIDLDQLKEGGK